MDIRINVKCTYEVDCDFENVPEEIAQYSSIWMKLRKVRMFLTGFPTISKRAMLPIGSMTFGM